MEASDISFYAWVVFLIIALVVVAAFVEAVIRRNRPRKPLSHYQPRKTYGLKQTEHGGLTYMAHSDEDIRRDQEAQRHRETRKAHDARDARLRHVSALDARSDRE